MNTRILATGLALWGTCLPAVHAAPDSIDRASVAEHIRKKFSTPKDLTLSIGDLRKSPLDGYLMGKITFKNAHGSNELDIHVSQDGRYYFLAPLYKMRDSAIPGFLTGYAEGDQQKPPDVFFTKDGKYFFLGHGIGAPQELGIDPDQINRDLISLKNVHARGPGHAPVVLVEFSDMQCPYCKVAHDLLSEKLVPTFGDSVRWVSKHYPLRNMHPWAYDAAIAVSCAGMQSQNGYRALQDGFFHDQKTITPENIRAKALKYAIDAGLKTEVFSACFDKKESADLVDADIREGDALGVNSTPTIYINGRKLGRLELDDIKAVVAEMKAAAKK